MITNREILRKVVLWEEIQGKLLWSNTPWMSPLNTKHITTSIIQQKCSSFYPGVLSLSYLNLLSCTLKCLKNYFLTVELNDSTILVACTGIMEWIQEPWCGLVSLLYPRSLFLTCSFSEMSWIVQLFGAGLAECSGENLLPMPTLQRGTNSCHLAGGTPVPWP